MEKNEQVIVDIFGSCVTRDLFSYELSNNLKCEEYIARQSMVSLFAKPQTYCEKDFAYINSSFQKNMLINDFEKTAFEKLEASKGNYVIVDFIDERFHIISIDRTYITYSTELMLSKYLDGKKYKILDQRKWINNKFFFHIIKKVGWFAEKLEEIYGVGHIIIHRATLKDCYLDKYGDIKKFSETYILDNKETNRLLNSMYNELERKLTKPHIIDVVDLYFAEETNKWGLATMHYQKEYYQDVIERIKQFVQ